MSPATRWILVTLALVLALAAPARPAAALDVFLRLFTEPSGEIQGDSLVSFEPNAIEVLSVAVSSVQTPVDVSTIRATGATQWTGLVLTKSFDRSSPRLLQAIIRRQSFRRAEVRFYSEGNNPIRVRTWTLDGGVFAIGLSSSAFTGQGPIVESLQLWACRISFRDDLSGIAGGADFCKGSEF